MTSPGGFSIALFRATMRGLSLIAPSYVERQLLDRFLTPRRSSNGEAATPAGEAWHVMSNGEQIAVYTSGTGPRVLLVHGWEGAASDFSVLAAALEARGFGVVSFDQPAHGRSTGRRTHVPAMARAALDVARATGPFVAVVGHSLGGSSVLLALRDGLPVRRAVILSPPRDARDFIEVLGGYMGVTRERVAGAIRLLWRRVGALGGQDMDRIVSQLRIPGLVLHDREDRAVPYTHGVAIAAAWQGARFVPLTGTGHRRALENPEVMEEILAFVDAPHPVPRTAA